LYQQSAVFSEVISRCWERAGGIGGDHENHARTRQIHPEYRVQRGEAPSARKLLLAFRRAFGSGTSAWAEKPRQRRSSRMYRIEQVHGLDF
jgi:hypothetical protein